MRILADQVGEQNRRQEARHREAFDFLASRLTVDGHDVDALLTKIAALQIAVPSWALGAGGTRFARFPGGGEPRSLEEKILDVGLLHALNRSSGAISLHIPWDIPKNTSVIKTLANELGHEFNAVNTSTSQALSEELVSY